MIARRGSENNNGEDKDQARIRRGRSSRRPTNPENGKTSQGRQLFGFISTSSPKSREEGSKNGLPGLLGLLEEEATL